MGCGCCVKQRPLLGRMDLDAERTKTAEEQGDEGYPELYTGMREGSFCL